jgi:hypothetical protein
MLSGGLPWQPAQLEGLPAVPGKVKYNSRPRWAFCAKAGLRALNAAMASAAQAAGSADWGRFPGCIESLFFLAAARRMARHNCLKTLTKFGF